MSAPAIDRIYALSPLQEGILFHTLSSPGTSTYFEQFSFTLNIDIDLVSLERAWQTVLDRHAVLRSSFHWKKLDKPFQVVHSPVKLPFEQQDWSALSVEEQQDRLQALLQADRARDFDLSVAPLFRMVAIRMAPAVWQLVISFHHVLLDGWSVAIVFREAAACYAAYCQGQEPSLEPVRPFEDYIAWLQQQDFGTAETFWRRMLDGYTGAVPISIDSAPGRMVGPGEPYQSQQTTISRATTAALQTLARTHQLTVNTVLQGAWAVLLSRYMGSNDVVFGVTASGRPVELKGIESMVGLFINTLPVRVQVQPEQPVLVWLKNLQRLQFEARQYEHTPLVDVQGWTDVPGGTALFETIVGFENYPILSAPQDDAGVVRLGDVFERTNYPLSLIVSPGPELGIVLMSVSTRFETESIARMLDHLRTLLEAIAADPDRRVSDLPMVTDAERRQLLVDWNETRTPYATSTCVHQLFEKWAADTPDAPAVSCKDERLTYAEVNRRANRVAHCLRSRRVTAGVPVAICLERSSSMLIAILGVLKAGAAYLPLDPAYPKQALAFMLRDSGARALLTSRDLASHVAEDAGNVLFMDAEEIASAPIENPAPVSTAEDLAYIIYTSGSTGRPRGVEIRHRSLLNLVCWHQREYAVTPQDRATQVAGPAFDASVWEIWPYLSAGASIHVIADDIRNSPHELIGCLAEEAVTLSFLPTALAEMVLDASWPDGMRLRALLTGGDKLHRAPRHDLPFVLVNHYGPTENTVVTTSAVVRPGTESAPPIGRPIDNVRVYVLDVHGQLAPVGVPGELCIAGDSLASGYRNLSELTAAKLVANPFDQTAGGRLYHTGDRVRYRADGHLDFLGRLDTQLKLRGFRVEPGEVETVLAQHPSVRESVVVAREDARGDARLVAYVVEQNGGGPSTPGGETPWEREQVARWSRVYQETYVQAAPADPRFNIIGWNSSYTGEPLSEAEMREQVDATVARIRALKPHRVLEIGCGTGLVLFRVARECQQYVATDFSTPAVEYVRRQLDDLPNVTVLQAAADDFSAIAAGAFDVVVLNSVVQYFPGAAYLERVLRGAVAALRPGGHLFIGDVRSLSLWEAFHTSVEVASADQDVRREDIQDGVRRRLRQEPELVVGLEFFAGLAARLPGVAGVEVQLRRGWSANELTAFRYDVWMVIDGGGAPVRPMEELRWDRLGSVAALRSRLAERDLESRVVRGVPNARVMEAVAALAWIRGGAAPSTVGAWRQLRAQTQPAGVEPEAIWQMANELGYEAHVGWGATADTADVLLRKPRPRTAAVATGWQRFKRVHSTLRSHTNDPQRGEADQRLIPVLRDYLRERLPDYMVPSAFMMLDALPLTPNGKVDRKNLPSPAAPPVARAGGFLAPQSDIERQIAGVWQEVLGVEAVGTSDNFFDLGGHSLLMVRVHGRLSEIFQGNLTVVDLLRYPTVASLAAFIATETEEPAVSLASSDRVSRQKDAFARQRPGASGR
jgi:amino acid adenylation domain-containing protein